MRQRLRNEGYSASVEFQGTLMRVNVKRPYVPISIVADTSKRGKISGFSQRSRKRLLDYTSRIDWQGQKAVFVTLTYPRVFPSAKEAKKHLKAFMERVRRRFPEASGLWRLEFQKRGAPHFHILFFNLEWWDKREVQQAWGEIIKYEKPFTRIELIRSWRKAMSYVSKYIAKRDSPENARGFNYLPYLHAGRVWGWFQKSKIPFAPCVVAILPIIDRQFYQFRRYMRRYWKKIKMRGVPIGWTIYREDLNQLKNLLMLSTSMPVCT